MSKDGGIGSYWKGWVLTKTHKAILFTLMALCLVIIGAGIWASIYVRGLTPRVKERVVDALSRRFDANVELKSLEVSLFPEPSVTGEELTIRHKQWDDPRPLLYIKRFSASTDFWTVINRRNHVSEVKLEGLDIRIPPRGRATEKTTEEDHEEVASAEPGQDKTQLTFSIGTIIADNTVLVIEPKQEGKYPLEFDIEKLKLRSLAPGAPMAFQAKLTNAKPPGLITTAGTFGPWQRDDPRATAVSGNYDFENADLGVFKGISGTLASTGKYKGILQHIEVDGETDTPNFALKRGGQPVHLETTFHSIVNGTDGDTLLEPVNASFLHTRFVCQGGVVHVDGTEGKTVSLDAVTKSARMEDILRLVTGEAAPMMTGAVDFKTKIVIPQGHEDVLDKLQLDGDFKLTSAQFTSEKVQQRLRTLSDRARGITKGEEQNRPAQTVASDLYGRFKLGKEVVAFSRLTFRVPGAAIDLAGDYNLKSEEVGMQGTFRMQVTLADTQSGVKHWLLKPLDPFFEKNGAGFVIPIDIKGTRKHPEIGATIFHHKFTID